MRIFRESVEVGGGGFLKRRGGGGIAVAQTIRGDRGSTTGGMAGRIGRSHVPSWKIPQGRPLHLDSSAPFQSPDLRASGQLGWWKETRTLSPKPWVHVLTLPCAICVAKSKWLHLSGPLLVRPPHRTS